MNLALGMIRKIAGISCRTCACFNNHKCNLLKQQTEVKLKRPENCPLKDFLFDVNASKTADSYSKRLELTDLPDLPLFLKELITNGIYALYRATVDKKDTYLMVASHGMFTLNEEGKVASTSTSDKADIVIKQMLYFNIPSKIHDLRI